MAGAGIVINVDDAAVKAAVSRAAAALDDMRPAFDEIGQRLVTSTLHRFETGAGPDGRKWKPSRRVQRGGGQTLVKDAHLRNSITHVASSDGVEVGTNVAYAAIHQFGGEIRPKSKKHLRFRTADGGWATVKSVTMPARPFLGIDGDDRRMIDDVVAAHLAGASR